MNEVELTVMGTLDHIEAFFQELHICQDSWSIKERAELYVTNSDYYKERLVAKQKEDGSIKVAFKTKIPVYSDVFMEYHDEEKKKFFQLLRDGISFNCLLFKKKQSQKTTLFDMSCKVVMDTVYPIEYKNKQELSFHNPFYHVEIELIQETSHEQRLLFFKQLDSYIQKCSLEMVTNETSKYKLASTKSQFFIMNSVDDLNAFFCRIFQKYKEVKSEG